MPDRAPGHGGFRADRPARRPDPLLARRVGRLGGEQGHHLAHAVEADQRHAVDLATVHQRTGIAVEGGEPGHPEAAQRRPVPVQIEHGVEHVVGRHQMGDPPAANRRQALVLPKSAPPAASAGPRRWWPWPSRIRIRRTAAASGAAGRRPLAIPNARITSSAWRVTFCWLCSTNFGLSGRARRREDGHAGLRQVRSRRQADVTGPASIRPRRNSSNPHCRHGAEALPRRPPPPAGINRDRSALSVRRVSSGIDFFQNGRENRCRGSPATGTAPSRRTGRRYRRPRRCGSAC